MFFYTVGRTRLKRKLLLESIPSIFPDPLTSELPTEKVRPAAAKLEQRRVSCVNCYDYVVFPCVIRYQTDSFQLTYMLDYIALVPCVVKKTAPPRISKIQEALGTSLLEYTTAVYTTN